MQTMPGLPDQTSPHPVSLHIGIECDRGGAGRVISELMTHLPEAGFGFRGIVANPPTATAGNNGAVKSFAPARANLFRRLHGARTAIRTAIDQFKPDIVASHFAMYSAPGMDLLKHIRIVSHFHGPWSEESSQEGAGNAAVAAKLYLEGTVYRRAHRVIVLSNAFGELITSRYGVDPSRIRLVPGSVDTKRFTLTAPRSHSRNALNLPSDRPILVTVRRLVNRMGLASLIDALKSITATVPDVLLCIAGQGPLRTSLQAQVERLGLNHNVRFLGFVTEDALPHLFYSADINVVPSMALEGFGLVAAEAMATGTPSMVTPVGGLPEVVGGLSQNLIFSGTQSTDIAEGLIAALTGATKLPTRDQCRNYIQNNFSSTLMARRTAQVYRELIDDDPLPCLAQGMRAPKR
ncbi:MAG TPA: glycosyltransferase family 4 protein [Edaphobacter sp.]|jgi:glycogen(starch) synthase|nr:glycosyltransferase family 4 protein [Edaphobacter sp.]